MTDQPLTDAELEQIEARSEASDRSVLAGEWVLPNSAAVRQFATEARTDIPRLIATVRSQRADIERLQKRVAELERSAEKAWSDGVEAGRAAQ